MKAPEWRSERAEEKLLKGCENYLRDTMLRNPGTYANKKRKKPALKQ